MSGAPTSDGATGTSTENEPVLDSPVVRQSEAPPVPPTETLTV